MRGQTRCDTPDAGARRSRIASEDSPLEGELRPELSHRRTTSESAVRGKRRSHDVPEDAVLGSKRLRAVVLVVPGGHRHHEIELRHDANVLAAAALGADRTERPSIGPDASEPPEIPIVLIVCRLDF